jgi:Tfp pilus assembly protein PilF
MNPVRLLAVALAAVILAGCESAPMKEVTSLFQSKGDKELATGIKQYEEGDYAQAQAHLQAALEAGLRSSADQVKAHKYLAFTYCVTSREKQCREEFRKLLEIDPNFELPPGEAGHPIWGPVFRSVKVRK